jgi:7,8-dihydropterin-6-yl-methyl-4-(beta-D-ribofuranosyl)aminobenzene 5'-phosphate synthase
MAAQAKQVTGGPMHAVMGGFHLGSRPKAELNAIVDRLHELGVERVAPCHCTGEQARNLFKQRFGETCSLAGVGSNFRFEQAK